MVLCDVLEEWKGGEVGGSLKREGVYVFIWLTYFVVQQKLTQRCKASIPNKKQIKLKRDRS